MIEKPALCYKIYDTRLTKWLRKHVGSGAENKKVPSFVKDLCSEQVEIILTYLYKGDGYKAKTAHTYYTVSKTLSDDIQELLIKAGYTFSHHQRKPRNSESNGVKIEANYPCHCILWLKNSNDFNMEHKTIRNNTESWVNYEGMVYCVTVPNHTLFIRRDGKGVWCGNSLRFYCNYSDDTFEGMINFAEYLSRNTCQQCGSRDNLGDTQGWIMRLCEDCKDNVNLKWIKREK